ncbi:DUF6158 family protein [Streptomyces sp. NPDC018045]|uniref:DUF6158 family protein n=1 Tax=Streptomyces sp. NPDC018045 TaxID=3365037 RepID=UPI00379AFCC5
MPSHDTPTDAPRPVETDSATPDSATLGVPPARLGEQQLLRELETIHRTRHDTLLHGSTDALATHNARMAELEGEYLRRHPRRWVASGRTRSGARARTG